jgi:Holliday junction resolvase RusA-like endonuclease
MNPRQLLRMFPNASKAVLAANASDYGTGIPDAGEPLKTLLAPKPDKVPHRTSVTILGKIRGGKNNMIVTKKGKHIPKREWASWRDDAVAQVRSQLPKEWEPVIHPVNVRIEYVAGDRRRRDFPAICDAIWHVLEKAGFCEDDTLLWPAESTRVYDKENPRATITII